MNRRNFILGLTGLVGATILYSSLEPVFIDVTKVKIDLGYNLKALHISDTHLHGYGYNFEELCKVISDNTKNVDLVFLTGDIYDEKTPSLKLLEDFLNCISKLKIVIYGNHEYYAHNKYSFSEVKRIYESYDSIVLVNESIELKGVKIGGIDWYFDEVGLGNKYLSEIGEVNILLSHTPDTFKLKNLHADIVLAGHTHGGQICLPLIGPLWVPSKYGTKYASGLFYENGIYMYVSRGLGEVIPMRFNCRRELVVLEL